MSMISFLLGLLLDKAYAQQGQMPYFPCVEVGALPGCGEATNVIADSLLPSVSLFLLRLVAGLSLLFLVWAGFQMVTSMGDDSKITQNKTAILFALGGLFMAIMSQALVSIVATYNYAIGNPNDFIVDGVLAYAVNILITLLNVTFVFVIIILGIRMVTSQGKTDDYNKARQGILWAIIGAIVVNLSHALVRVVLTFFGL